MFVRLIKAHLLIKETHYLHAIDSACLYASVELWLFPPIPIDFPAAAPLGKNT